MPLEPGVRLGPYEINGAIGAGGMGEVYRARDTRLDRSVAIKVLPAAFAADAQLRLRFDREAKVISSLNDPHICTLYDVGHDDGRDYLVMELLDGETLADRLSRGPLSAKEVFEYGIQIAEALDRAHRQGVIHRDLKPGNVMLTGSGVKLLDFGLAKSGAQAGSPLLQGETAHKPLTAEGTIIGTFQYMAPEQLESLEADARTDIFALGAVLYEMTTGKRAFEGKSRTSLIAAIVGAQPTPVSKLQPLTPPALEHVIDRCLEKDPAARWQSARDIAEELKWINAKGSQIGLAAPLAARRRLRERLSWGLYPLVAVVAAAGMWGALKLRSEPPRMVVAMILPPPKAQFTFNAAGGPLISPDGTRIVFPAALDGVSRLWVRPLSGGTAQPLAGTEEGIHPFWSPDSRMIGFFADGKLKKIDVSGGPAQALCDASNGRGGAWSSDGTIVFAPTVSSVLFRVADTGGNPAQITTLDVAHGEVDHRWPAFLPDGRHFIYLAEGRSDAECVVYAMSTDGKQKTRLLQANSNVFFAEKHLLFWRDGSLVAQAFDPGTLTLGRDIVPLAENVAHTAKNDALFSLSTKGDLVYQSGNAITLTQPTWYDANGKVLQAIGKPANGRMVALSHDGRRVARSVREQGREDIWIEDLLRGTATRFTFDPSDQFMPIWSADDSRIVYSSATKSPGNLMIRNSFGTGAEETLYASDAFKVAIGWSSDGKLLAFSSIAPGRSDFDIWFYSFQDKKASPFLQTPFDEIGGTFSPDGRWIAYQSNESGKGQIYVLPVTGNGGKWQISTDGGTRARWSRDGKQIFYIAPDWKLMVVDVSWEGERFEAGVPRALFQTNMYHTPGFNYDVSADGKRFIVDTQLEQQDIAPITLVQNWTRVLKK